MKIWSFILAKSSESKKVVLMVVIDNYGSSPGRKGFKMAVSEDGDLQGSIGGGMMEQSLVEETRQRISDSNDRIILKHQEHHPEALENKSGLICSGSQTIAFFPVTRTLLQEVKVIFNYQQKKGIGLISYSSKGIRLVEEKHQDEKYESNIVSDHDWVLTEQTGKPDTLYIFGAGHVSLALSRICAILDFEIELFDDRKDLSTYHENTYVRNKQLIDYTDIEHLVQEGSNSYVVIMSFSHESDETILKQLLKKKIKYLGMLGSKMKIKKIREHLDNDGFTKQDLTFLHAPIGIKINSQTPEEIAISIAAQMISERNKGV